MKVALFLLSLLFSLTAPALSKNVKKTTQYFEKETSGELNKKISYQFAHKHELLPSEEKNLESIVRQTGKAIIHLAQENHYKQWFAQNLKVVRFVYKKGMARAQVKQVKGTLIVTSDYSAPARDMQERLKKIAPQK